MKTLRIKIDAESWNYMGNINRETFNNYLIGILSPYFTSKDDLSKTVITFPRTLSKLERYNIHKLSDICFRTLSYDNQYEDRILELTLYKDYVEDLFEGFVFKKPEMETADQPEPQKTEKQMLFDTLIGFIESSLGMEFKDYLSTI
jgi:hypothetical protein